MLIFIMRIDICHINFQPTLFFYFFIFIKWNINVGDCFTLCYFCLITNVQCLVGSLHEELGEGMGSSTHINSNCDAHRWQNDNGTWHMGKLAFFFFFFSSSPPHNSHKEHFGDSLQAICMETPFENGFVLYYTGKFIVTGKGETGKNEDTYNNQHTGKSSIISLQGYIQTQGIHTN